MGILPIVNVQDQYPENLMFKQMIYIALGIIVTITVMLIDYRKIKKFGWPFLIAAIGLLFALNFFPSVVINGVGYLEFVGFTISGSSLLPLFVVFWAYYFSKEKPKLFVIIGVYLRSVLLFLGLPSFSAVFIYSILVLALFCCSSIRKKTIYTTIGVSIGLVITVIYFFWFTVRDYSKVRLLSFLNPNEYSHNAGYMYIVLKDLISKGAGSEIKSHRSLLE
jgi:cell division protein FtsW (lipid II flippase)